MGKPEIIRCRTMRQKRKTMQVKWASVYPAWNNCNETLASLGIMEAQLRAMKPLLTSQHYVTEELIGSLNLSLFAQNIWRNFLKPGSSNLLDIFLNPVVIVLASIIMPQVEGSTRSFFIENK